MAQVEDFVKHLEFGAGHAPSELLVEVHPILDELTLKALHMLRFVYLFKRMRTRTTSTNFSNHEMKIILWLGLIFFVCALMLCVVVVAIVVTDSTRLRKPIHE